jgi:hypothetical protein
MDSTAQDIATSGFWDNFLWPVLVALVLGIGAAIGKYVTRKRIKITIDHAASFIGQHNGTDYAIICGSIVNETEHPLNTIQVSTLPAYNFLNGVWTMLHGARYTQGATSTFIAPLPINLVPDATDGSNPLNLQPKDKLDFKFVLEIQNRNRGLNKFVFSYLTTRIECSVALAKLPTRPLES